MNDINTWEKFLESDIDSWSNIILGDLFHNRQEKNRSDLRLLSVTGSEGVIDRDSLERRDTSNSDKSKYLRVAPNDIAYNTMRMWQGVCGRSTKEGIVSPAYTVLNPTEKIDSEYASFFLKHPLLIQRFHQSSQGLVDDTLNLKYQNFSKISVKIPSLSEQKKIAAILTSVDEVIEKTQAQISKLEDLKRATMNELLTKGIGHTEFKETEIGRIPKSWSISKLDEIAKRGSGHTPSKQHPEYWNGGIKWVSLADSHRLDQREINITDKQISEMGLKNSSAVMHPKGTVILSRDAGVGKSTIIGEEMAVSQHFMAWQCGEKLNNLYLYFWLQFKKNVFENIAIGSTIKTIGLDYFKKLTIALPSLNEQLKIATVINRQEDYLFQLSNKLTNLKNLKKALMQDLLTGKVRVSVN